MLSLSKQMLNLLVCRFDKHLEREKDTVYY